jgi:hypothetical protein
MPMRQCCPPRLPQGVSYQSPSRPASPTWSCSLAGSWAAQSAPLSAALLTLPLQLTWGTSITLQPLQKAFPHAVAAIFSAADHNPIILSGIVQQGGASVTTDLMVAFQFHMPYLMRKGTLTTLLVACGPNVTVNCILGLPFIQATKMVIDAADQVANLCALDTPPFPLDLSHAMYTVPAVGGPPDDESAVRYAKVIAKVNRVEGLYSSKSLPAPTPPGILRPAKCTKNVKFDSSFADDGYIVTIGLAIDPKLEDDTNVSHAYDAPPSAKVAICLR